MCASVRDVSVRQASAAVLTPAVGGIALPVAVPVAGVQHGDVAALVLQVHPLPQRAQGLVDAHVGRGEL